MAHRRKGKGKGKGVIDTPYSESNMLTRGKGRKKGRGKKRR